ncbi:MULTISPECIES: phage tail tape measure protein [unclassified Shinella]|uniref:phage tail tape measure protein n=1 Tax=unclassified Shinella TaxID=2643062 RepID=UPI00234F998B|nr:MULTISPECIES: phage tail tape measure protein [unclassified Shinella]MCO5135990.1 phage tail tape measure protein [Shinella sp.]MDC7254375.1 phage tail tape measure protein [Shinella sp. YE25]
MAKRQAELVLSLTDKVSGRAKGVHAALAKLQMMAARNAAAMDAMRGRMFDAIAVGYTLARSLTAPVKAAVAFESKLEDIGQKADIPQKRLAELGKQLRLIGRQTNQAGSQMAEGMDTLLGLGASEGDALKLLPNIGKAAFAYKASITDLSSAGYAALDNLKVPADQFGKALDAMARAGKAGAFELKDMAQYFPALGAGYQALGQTGVPAVADLSAALQIVRKGTGDSASAATNLSNVLQKINAPQTVKAFKKLGVNLERELKKRAEAGMSPIEAIADITNKTLKGDLSKIGDLFADSQVQQGLRPLIQSLEEFRRIRAEAMAAQGTVEADFQRRMKTSEGALLRMQAALENISASIGAALLPALNQVIDKVAPIVTSIADLAERYPEATSAIVAATAAVVGFNIAMTATRFAFLWTKGGVLSMVIPVARLASHFTTAATEAVALQRSLKALSTSKNAGMAAMLDGGLNGAALTKLETVRAALGGMAAAVPGVTAIGGALTTVGAALATISAPAWLAIGAGVALVAGAGLALWQNWDRISSTVAGVARAIGEELQPAIDFLWPVLDPFAQSFSALGDAAKWAWEQFKEAASWLGSLFQSNDLTRQHQMVIEDNAYAVTRKLIDGFKALNSAMFQAGVDMIQGIIDGVVAKAGELLAWFADLPAKIRAAVGRIDLSGLISWGSLNPFGGGETTTSTPAVDGARAKGGPVRAGRTYLVGERGAELFSPGASGMISPHDAYRAAAAGSAASVGGPVRSGGNTITISPTINIHGGMPVGSDPHAVARHYSKEIGDYLISELEGAHGFDLNDGRHT